MGGERKESGTQIDMVAPIRLDVLKTEGAMTALESETVEEKDAQVDDLITVEKYAPSQNAESGIGLLLQIASLTLLFVLVTAHGAASGLPKAHDASCTENKYLYKSAQRSGQRT